MIKTLHLFLFLSNLSVCLATPLINKTILQNDKNHFRKIHPVSQFFWYDKLILSPHPHYQTVTNSFDQVINQGVALPSSEKLARLTPQKLSNFLSEHPPTQLSYNALWNASSASRRKDSDKLKISDYRLNKKIPTPKWNGPTTARMQLVELRWKLNQAKDYSAIDGFIATTRSIGSKQERVIFKLHKANPPVFFDYETSGKVMYTIYAYRGNQRSRGHGVVYKIKKYDPSGIRLANTTEVSLVNLASDKNIVNQRLVMFYSLSAQETSDAWVKVSMKIKQQQWARYSLITPMQSIKKDAPKDTYISLLNVYVKEGYYYNDWDTLRIKSLDDRNSSRNLTVVDFLTRGGSVNKNLVIKNNRKIIFQANYRQNNSYNYIPVRYEILNNDKSEPNSFQLNLLSRLYQTNDANCCPSFSYKNSFLYSEKEGGKFLLNDQQLIPLKK